MASIHQHFPSADIAFNKQHTAQTCSPLYPSWYTPSPTTTPQKSSLNCFSEDVFITKYGTKAINLENFKVFDLSPEGLFLNNLQWNLVGRIVISPASPRVSPLGLARRRWPGAWSGHRGCSCGRQTSRSPCPAWPGSRGGAACGSAAHRTWRRRSPVGPKETFIRMITLP